MQRGDKTVQKKLRIPRNAGQAWPIEDPALAGKDQALVCP